MKNFLEYFDYSKQYANPVHFLMEEGVLLQYVSSSFLNGWINYLEPLSIRLITRYAEDGYAGNLARAEAWHKDRKPYPKLSDLRDDVLILAKPKMRRYLLIEHRDMLGEYWFFWFDNDVSDCQIGRFKTVAGEPAVVESFERYAEDICQELSAEYQEDRKSVGSISIDPKTLGWVEF